MMDIKKQIDLTIPMVPQMEIAASKMAAAAGEFMGLDEDKTDEVKFALIEACINAFEHSKSKDRKVYITFDVEDDLLTITIQDYGEGFNRNSIEVPKIKDKMKSNYKRGWGLHLMETFMDELKIDSNEKGTKITMVKRR